MDTSFDHPALVGRDDQVALVDRLLRAVRADAQTADPRARALLVRGDAGIGKSALVEAVAEHCRDLRLSCAVGHCLDLATGVPFGPVVEALRDLLDHRAPHTPPSAARTAWLASGPRSMSASLESLIEAAEVLGEQSPFVLVIEDLHWADASVRDFALALVRTCRAPVLLVLTLRDDDVTGTHPLRSSLRELIRCPRAVIIDLGGLPADDVRELALRRSGRALDGDELASLMARSDGNPLYVEELVAAHEPGVPRQLHDLLLRHVENLSTPAIQLARLASVGGSRLDRASLGVRRLPRPPRSRRRGLAARPRGLGLGGHRRQAVRLRSGRRPLRACPEPLGPGARCGCPHRARADRPPASGRTRAGQRGRARTGAH